MLVADTGSHGNRSDAAEDRGPEGVDELLIVGEQQDQLVAPARADPLQVIQDAQSALVELAERYLARVVLAFEIGDAARHGTVAFDQLDERGGFQHQRRSSLMESG